MTAFRAYLLALPLLGASPAFAAEVSQDAIDACIDQVRAVGGPDAASGGRVESTEFSQANSLVMLRDGGGTLWRCLVSNRGQVEDLSVVEAADDGAGAGGGRTFVAEADMGRFCAGEASAEFGVRPQEILTLPVEKGRNGHFAVYGQFPPEGSSVTTFVCTFGPKGGFERVRKTN